MRETMAAEPWMVGASDEQGPNPWVGQEPGTCAEPGCTAPQRRLLRYRGGVYISEWCWAHGCCCMVCHGAIDDGEDLCAYHSELFGVRYVSDLPDRVRQLVQAGTYLLPAPSTGDPTDE